MRALTLIQPWTGWAQAGPSDREPRPHADSGKSGIDGAPFRDYNKDMTNTNAAKLTADTIARDQIRQLRDEAQAASDLVQVDLCNVALSGEDSDGTGTTLGTPCTAAYARQACADAINDARAQADA